MMPLSAAAAQPRIDVEQFRPRLFGIAYRMLGDVEESRDIVQDAFVRWHQADRSAVEVPEAWLVRVTTRLAIDRRRRLATERAAYVGPWLPEPIPTTEQTRPDGNVELASDLSMAFLVLLERLAPEERAAFLLREVFDTDYAEIAAALDRSEAAVRQIVHRARERVRDGKRRLAVGREVQEPLIERFLAAVAAEDRDALLAVFDAHATFASDGGGKVSAARRVIEGPDRIARFLLGVQRKWGSLFRHSRIVLNGQPAVLTTIATDGRIFGTTSFAMEAGRITAVYRVMNPDKLRAVEQAFQA